MRSLLSVLAFAWVLLAPAPALSQTPQADPSAAGAQYDQYNPISTPVGPETAERAVRAATAALDAIRSSAEEAQADEGNPVSAAEPPRATDLALAGGAITEDPNEDSKGTAEAQDESPPEEDRQELPDTGGPSPLWLAAAPLLFAGGLLARRILI